MPRAHLLVVDDEPAILTTLQKTLSLEGYGVDVAGGVKIAEEKLKKRSYDLCLFDVSLPDGNGLDLLAKVRESKETALIPVLMMSGHATIDAAVRATRLGALNFIEKPLNTDALLIMIETALRLERAEAEAKALRAVTQGTGELVGASESMRKLNEQIVRAAKSAASVLVTGERGTGKELVAARDSPALAAGEGTAREAELCGPAQRADRERAVRARGGRLHRRDQAAAGQVRAGERRHALPRRGRRHAARNAGEAPARAAMSARSSGSAATRRSRSTPGSSRRPTAISSARRRRISSAPTSTTASNVVPLHIPPLRARRSDVPLLAKHFLELAAKANDRRNIRIDDSAIIALAAYSFPGNVRELRNLLERLVILTPDDVIKADDVRACLPGGSAPKATGLYRPGVPFRVLVEEAERTILDRRAHPQRRADGGDGPWSRSPSAAICTRRPGPSVSAGRRRTATTTSSRRAGASHRHHPPRCEPTPCRRSRRPRSAAPPRSSAPRAEFTSMGGFGTAGWAAERLDRADSARAGAGELLRGGRAERLDRLVHRAVMAHVGLCLGQAREGKEAVTNLRHQVEHQEAGGIADRAQESIARRAGEPHQGVKEPDDPEDGSVLGERARDDVALQPRLRAERTPDERIDSDERARADEPPEATCDRARWRSPR